MTVRFRIRTSAGQELSFASREMFEDFVRSGDLSPDDLVYDAETGSWSPARTHPMVLDIQYELEAEDEDGSTAGDDSTPEGGSTAGGASEATRAEKEDATPEPGATDEPSPDSAFGLSLAPEAESTAEEADRPADPDGDSSPDPDEAGVDLGLELALTEQTSPEEERKAFLEQLEAERRADLDSGPSIRESLSGFTSDTLAPRAEPRPPPRTPDPPPRPSKSSGPEASRGGSKVHADGKDAGAPQPGGLGRALLRVAVLVLVVGGGYVAFQGLAAGPEPAVDGGDAAAERPVQPVDEAPEPEVEPTPPEMEPEPTPEPVIPSTPAAVRERAQERYLTSTQTALRDLQPVPEVWPEGPYLTTPSEHPEVLDVWQDYRSTIRAVRGADGERYRTAYDAALDDAAIAAEARQEWIDTALEEFAAGAEFRDAHFDRVEALATAAIQSHNALLEAEGLILFDPTGSTGRSEGVGQGTSGRNDESQLLLDQVLELITDALDADGEGPGAGENVREWVWGGFLDAATR